MFRNPPEPSPTYDFQPKALHNYKSTASPPPQPKSYTPLRSRLLQGSTINSTPIASKLPNQRTQSPLLNRILSKENVPISSNQLGKSPSKQFNLGKARLNDSEETFTKSPLNNVYQPSVSPTTNWKLITPHSQYDSTPPGSAKNPPRIMLSKNSSGDQQNILMSKTLQPQFHKKNSIQSTSPLLSGLINKRNSNKNSTPFTRANIEQYEQSGSMNDSKFQFASNAFSKFKSNSSFMQKQNEDVMCRNNDNKKAKYQVLNTNDDSDEQNQVYYYCAKCAIHVTQQGFKVQEIEQTSDIRTHNSNIHNYHSTNTKYSKYEPTLSCPEAEELLEHLKQTSRRILTKQNKINGLIQSNNVHYQNDIDRIDSYYNSLIETIENLRVRDRETVVSHRNKSEKSIQNLSKRLEEAASQISTINHQLQTKPDIALHMQDTLYERLEDYNSILTQSETIPSKQLRINQDELQDKYEEFMESFENTFGVSITLSKVEQSRQTISFSFEKARHYDKRISPMQEHIPEEEDRIVSQDEEMTKEPFRTLFPDESEAESNQYEEREGRFNCEVEMEGNYEEEGGLCGSVEDGDDILLSSCNEGQQIDHSPSFKNI